MTPRSLIREEARYTRHRKAGIYRHRKAGIYRNTDLLGAELVRVYVRLQQLRDLRDRLEAGLPGAEHGYDATFTLPRVYEALHHRARPWAATSRTAHTTYGHLEDLHGELITFPGPDEHGHAILRAYNSFGVLEAH